MSFSDSAKWLSEHPADWVSLPSCWKEVQKLSVNSVLMEVTSVAWKVSIVISLSSLPSHSYHPFNDPSPGKRDSNVTNMNWSRSPDHHRDWEDSKGLTYSMYWVDWMNCSEDWSISLPKFVHHHFKRQTEQVGQIVWKTAWKHLSPNKQGQMKSQMFPAA